MTGYRRNVYEVCYTTGSQNKGYNTAMDIKKKKNYKLDMDDRNKTDSYLQRYRHLANALMNI